MTDKCVLCGTNLSTASFGDLCRACHAAAMPSSSQIVFTTPVKVCRQCGGSKRVFVKGVNDPWSPPVKVVCGECAEDKP